MAVAVSVAAQSGDRIDTKVALAQLMTKVDPVVPAAAAAAGVGGVVIADVTIGVNGRVLDVSILGGPAQLHGAAQTALRQWTFKPFVRNGKPRAVITILEVTFPDPVREARERDREALRAAQWACDREAEKSRATAAAACKPAYEVATRIGFGPIVPNNYGMEEMAARTYLSSLIAAGQFPDALVVARDMLARRSPVKAGDGIAAEYQVSVALLQQRTGAYDDAEASFVRADEMYDALAGQSASARESIAATMKQALSLHAAFRRSRGDEPGAALLEARAANLAAVERPERTVPLRTGDGLRRVGDVTLRESNEARLSEDDLQQIQTMVAPKRAWWITVTQMSGGGAPPTPAVHACLDAEVVTPSLRRGTCVMLVKQTPGSGQKIGWQRFGQDHAFVQLPENEAAGARAPIEIRTAGEVKLPSDEMIISLFAYVRGKAVPAETTLRRSDVQPWPFESVLMMNGEWRVRLQKPDGSAIQDVTVRPQGSVWEIVEMR